MSSPSSKEGVALLVHTSGAPTAPAPLLQTCSIVVGEYNGVLLNTDTTAVQPNLWL